MQPIGPLQGRNARGGQHGKLGLRGDWPTQDFYLLLVALNVAQKKISSTINIWTDVIYLYNIQKNKTCGRARRFLDD
jgi:hypothetical protein